MSATRWKLRPAFPGDMYDQWFSHWRILGYHPAIAAILAHYDATRWWQERRR